MNYRMVHKRCVLFARNFSGSGPMPCTVQQKPQTTPVGLEREYLYSVLASRPAYVVGKLHSVEVTKCAPNVVRNFLDTGLQQMNSYHLTELGNEIPRLPCTNVYALLLKLQSQTSTETPLADKNRRRHLLVALSKRATSLSKSEQSLEVDFTLADLLYRAGFSQDHYNELMLQRQSLALKYLSKADFIQHLFFSHSVRRLQPNTIAAVPIFIEKCQYRLPDSKQWMRIVDALEKHNGEIPDIALGVFAKYMRYLHPTKKREQAHLKKFIEVIPQKQSDWSLQVGLRLATVGTQAGMCDSTVIANVTAKMIEQLDTCRIKDVALCLHTNAFFDVQMQQRDVEAVIARLSNEEVTPSFHPWLIRATLALAMMRFYDKNLLIRSLDANVIDFANAHKNSKFDVYALWTLCKIMFPDLLKNDIHLTEEALDICRNKIMESADCSSIQSALMEKLQSLVETKLFLRAEFVQTLDLFAQKDLHVENKLVIVCHLQTSYSNQMKLLGLKKFRVTLLKAAKYNVVEIHPNFFTHLLEVKQIEKLRELMEKHMPV